ncbi:PREDICTED: uncharacterized protein LOC105363315 [Ceratosolen solmsi marchali]|uniref:Uncharacterized protein LOC105363315 n=1 Tax=Ceratosolen solmsi marchali TaxID=326594 RepID=A0AAJ6YJM7_9HYME|nr:PREDICTED: uncharacterized protein LOC105363315 [Ceratosolen solmsi marchali]
MFTHRLSLSRPIVLLLLLFQGLGLASVGDAEVTPSEPHFPSSAIRIDKASLDKVIDKNMKSIQDALLPIDPLNLKTIHYPITSKIYLDLRNGWMQNLSLVNRVGPCTLTYTNKVLTADINFGWDKIVADFRYKLKMIFMSRKGDAHVKVSHLSVNTVIDVDFNNYLIILKRLEFVHKGKINVSIQGHIIDKIYNLIIKAITSIVQKSIFKTIESKATEMIQSEIDEINQIISDHHHPFTFLNLVALNNSDVFVS